eukprot:4947363-Pyramimonas_sp.AAC.1
MRCEKCFVQRVRCHLHSSIDVDVAAHDGDRHIARDSDVRDHFAFLVGRTPAPTPTPRPATTPA